jgi:hypothetical protein
MSQIKIEIPDKKIADFCRRWKITEFALFGSALRNDFRHDSDIDVLVSFAPDTAWGLFDHVTMQDELQAIFNCKVDLINRRAIERSRNPIRRKAILTSAEVIYAA